MKRFNIEFLTPHSRMTINKLFYSNSEDQVREQFSKLFPQWTIIYVVEEVDSHDAG